MTILIAPDKFKGSMDALQVCKAIERGIKKRAPTTQCLLHPLADGGEGSIDILSSHLSLQKVTVKTTNPLGQTMEAYYYQNKKAAFIELAAASGISLLTPKQQNPLLTSTEGTGRMIWDAIQRGHQNIYLFIGGSATNDAAMGIAHALGYRFLDQKKHLISPKGANLSKISYINEEQLFFDKSKVHFTILCDVDNPLFGKNGAAYVYAQQKGANPEAIEVLDQGLRHFAHIVQEQYEKDLSLIAGGGAAGGVAAGMAALFNTKIQSGIQAILQLTNFEQKVQQSDLIISGEGQLDEQTLSGKVISRVAQLAIQYHRPLHLIVGQNQLSPEASQTLHAQKIHSILDHAQDINEAMKKGAEIIEKIIKKEIPLPPK